MNHCQRIAYFVHLNHPPNSGVFKKIFGQIRQWVAHGANVALFVLTAEECGSEYWQNLDERVAVHVQRYHRFVQRFNASRQMAEDILRWDPHLVYTRYGLYYPAFRFLAKRAPLVVEINGNEFRELLLRSRSRYWYNRLTRSLWLLSVKGFVFVTHELARLQHYARYNKPSAVIPNGIDLSQYPHPFPAPDNEVPHIAFISSNWFAPEGIDKILWLASQCPEWHFDLIGKGSSAFAEEAPSNVFLHGFMPRSEYESFIEKADVALSLLALHRTGLNEASPLSGREMLAYGIPTIIGYNDSDFPKAPDFLLELPCSSDNVHSNIGVIKDFVRWARGKRVPREAIAHLDIAVKERRRLEFFDDVVTAQ